MKSEKEIKELKEKLDSKNPSIKELDADGFLSFSDKAGHWADCLDWILGK